jgi:8-oxo-dGTP pyrophosphatase MutT (NUDIX family)
VGRRIDFYDDPAAPEANRLVPSVNVVVTNRAGDVLLIRRSDNDNWAVPGGAIDLGESPVQAAVRETREETGIDCGGGSGHAEGPGRQAWPPSPAWRALTTASARVLTPSLASTAETWLRTVLRLSTKWSAM